MAGKRERKQRPRQKHIVNFRIRPKYVVFATISAVIAFFFLNPKPAEVNLDNMYRKLAHTFIHEESEYLADAYVQDILEQDGMFDQGSQLAAVFENDPVNAVSEPPVSRFLTTVLPAQTQVALQNDQKWIEVDLSDQKLFAWENGNKAFEFVISSGKPWTPTLKGEFRIWIKLRSANMKGGSKERGDYYFLPNVPYVMYYDRGYGIHGTYWHNNFGQVMSHGCVNLRTEDAGQLFAWVGPYLDGKSVAKSTPENLGTRVIVHD